MVRQNKYMNQVDRLLINLKIIASLEPYQKLNTKSGHQLVIESAWASTSFYRWVREDTRHNTVKRIGEILQEAAGILNISSDTAAGGISSNTVVVTTEYVSDEYRGRIMSQLRETRTGMVNLRTTYESDPTITAHFDVLLERIDTFLKSPAYQSSIRYIDRTETKAKAKTKTTKKLNTVTPAVKINSMSSSDSSLGGVTSEEEEEEEEEEGKNQEVTLVFGDDSDD